MLGCNSVIEKKYMVPYNASGNELHSNSHFRFSHTIIALSSKFVKIVDNCVIFKA